MNDGGKHQIGAQQVGIGGVLKSYRLVVPPNQREYSWTESEVTKLFQDFQRAVAEEEYFLGSVVTITRGPDVLEVVDGQQRLATVALFLAQIRNYLQESEKLIAESITSGFLTDIDRERRERVAKLQLNLADNEYFRSLLNLEKGAAPPDPGLKPSNKLLAETFKLAKSQVDRIVSGYAAKDQGDVLNRWIKFMEFGAEVILLKVPTDKNAYRMFETLNDRGLRTSQADLVKNYLFGRSAQRLPEAEQKWAAMRTSLEALEEEEITLTFLRHSMTAIAGYITADELYDTVQDRAKSSQAVIELLAKLEKLAYSYAAMLTSASEKWNAYPDAARRAIDTLDYINIRPLRPLMLAVSERFEPKAATEALRMFVSWSVRLLIASSTRSESVIEPFASAANEVYESKIQTAAQLKKRLSDVIPVDEQFTQGFETATVSKAGLARYYLRSLEMAAQKEAEPWFLPNDDKQVINLEHVLPERPENNWPDWTDEKVKTYAKRIGNLALLQAKSNSDLKSANFETKKKVYEESPYSLTKQIAGEDMWNEDKIVARQKQLAKIALEAWPI